MKDLAFELDPKVRAKFLYSKMRGNNISPEERKKLIRGVEVDEMLT